MKSEKNKSHVSEKKLKEVKEIKKLIEEKRTVLIASIKNIPGSQFQEIVKKLRGKAVIKVPKKNLIYRAIDQLNKKEISELKNQIGADVAILFSDLDSFDLAADLIESKSPAKAKPGQEAPTDIVIEEGPTELVPGPAISELGAFGIQIQIEKGKIHIKEPRVIVKQGEKIKTTAAELMAKLDIKPFSVGFVPLCSFDTKENKLYLEIKIDKATTLNNLKEAFAKALAFAVERGYSTPETISFMIAKAAAHEKAIDNLLENVQTPQVNSEENK